MSNLFSDESIFSVEAEQELDGALVFAAFEDVEDVGDVDLLHLPVLVEQVRRHHLERIQLEIGWVECRK